MDVVAILAQELSLRSGQVQAALDLLAEGATVPFIARYRKERTGELDEIQLRQLAERHQYLLELNARKQTILETIAAQGKLTPALQQQIEPCLSKTELEDLYLPYRPKRRTRATIAREKGLEPLAREIDRLNQRGEKRVNLENIAQAYCRPEAGTETNAGQVGTVADALKGAADILAEELAEQAPLRSLVRQYLLKHGILRSKVKGDSPEGTTKYEMYRNYQMPLRQIAPHNLLAVLRGEKEGLLRVALDFEEDPLLDQILDRQLRSPAQSLQVFYQDLVKDAFHRLMKPSLSNEIMAEKKAWADGESIQTFADNLKNLLLAAPGGMKPTLGIDPGFRTGCKVAVVSETGQFLDYKVIFPHLGKGKQEEAATILQHLIAQYHIALIAIGNGTAGRETEAFVRESLQTVEHPPIPVMVNESGASIYSASEVAIAEFPDLDLTVRGAISIARRLQDPLAELVKIDPKSIGVGQYQHDVDQKQLKQKLDETVESCVNYVGVDLNLASRELLTYVSGITPTVANNIVEYRNQIGAFSDRQSLLKVKKLGPKLFEQAAGFLRIRNGKNPLDNTAVHPERYALVQQMLQDLGIAPTQIQQATTQLKQLKQINLDRYTTDTVGAPTLRDILRELEKPGRDPRAQFSYATFKPEIRSISDLEVGMTLEGIVTNVANFGAFVDIGVHQDGLVHISQMADRFVQDPKDIVQVGQVVTVRVMEIKEKLKRISLSLRI
ncbi:MAG: hypothetical protein RLZZ435_595 [Cyanobacteriota bacterium]